MGFLDNSGDIILDAVLTDTGRERIARGDGSFKIVKFALCDDEINYALFDKTHASGSAYYDLQILQSPIFEAFTNNASTMNSKLITISRSNLLYLPVIKVNELVTPRHSSDTWIVASDSTTEDKLLLTGSAASTLGGILKGERPTQDEKFIRVDQGLDTSERSPEGVLDPDLKETQYMIRIDNRLGSIVSKDAKISANISYIDDDNIATYLVNLGTDPSFVRDNTNKERNTGSETIAGPRGTILEFKVKSSIELQSSTYLFTELGSTVSISTNDPATTATCNFIDTIVRVEGSTTGYAVDIPVRFMKYPQ